MCYAHLSQSDIAQPSDFARLMRIRRRDPRYMASLALARRTPLALARRMLREAVAMAPHDHHVILADIEIRLRLGDADGALARAEAIGPEATAWDRDRARMLVARGHHMAGRDDKALEMLEAILTRRPNLDQARRMMRDLQRAKPPIAPIPAH